jgi:hypothetical protein
VLQTPERSISGIRLGLPVSELRTRWGLTGGYLRRLRSRSSRGLRFSESVEESFSDAPNTTVHNGVPNEGGGIVANRSIGSRVVSQVVWSRLADCTGTVVDNRVSTGDRLSVGGRSSTSVGGCPSTGDRLSIRYLIVVSASVATGSRHTTMSAVRVSADRNSGHGGVVASVPELRLPIGVRAGDSFDRLTHTARPGIVPELA